MLVTHDRYMLDRVSKIVLGLDGLGSAESFADYSQWEAWQSERKQPAKTTRSRRETIAAERSTETKKKLSYLEAREYATIEQRVGEAEHVLQEKRLQLKTLRLRAMDPVF